MLTPIPYGWLGRGQLAVAVTTTIDGTHRGLTIVCGNGTFTLNLTAIATLGAGYHIAIVKAGTGTTTLDAAAAETLRFPASSATTQTLVQGQGVILVVTATEWDAVAGCGLGVAPSTGATFYDSVFTIQDNSDPTKQFQFQASGITAGQTRVYTMPNGDTTVSGLSITQTFTAANTFSGSALTPVNITRSDVSGTDATVLALTSASGGSLQFRIDDLSLANPVHRLNVNTSEALSFNVNLTEQFRMTASGQLCLGVAATRQVGTVSGARLFQEGLNAATSSQVLVKNSADGVGPVYTFGKTRGTATGASDAVVDGDDLGSFNFAGGDGTDVTTRGATILAEVEGTVSTGIIPARLRFFTSNTAGAQTEGLRIDSVQGVQIRSSFSTTSPGSGQLYVRGLQVDAQTITTTGAIAALASDTGSIRMTGAAPDIQGVTAPAIGSRRLVIYFANATTIRNENATASAPNRIITGTGADIASAALSVYQFIYDETSTRWRIA